MFWGVNPWLFGSLLPSIQYNVLPLPDTALNVPVVNLQ